MNMLSKGFWEHFLLIFLVYQSLASNCQDTGRLVLTVYSWQLLVYSNIAFCYCNKMPVTIKLWRKKKVCLGSVSVHGHLASLSVNLRISSIWQKRQRDIYIYIVCVCVYVCVCVCILSIISLKSRSNWNPDKAGLMRQGGTCEEGVVKETRGLMWKECEASHEWRYEAEYECGREGRQEGGLPPEQLVSPNRKGYISLLRL
jgi:hypothetical protein